MRVCLCVCFCVGVGVGVFVCLGACLFVCLRVCLCVCVLLLKGSFARLATRETKRNTDILGSPCFETYHVLFRLDELPHSPAAEFDHDLTARAHASRSSFGPSQTPAQCKAGNWGKGIDGLEPRSAQLAVELLASSYRCQPGASPCFMVRCNLCARKSTRDPRKT